MRKQILAMPVDDNRPIPRSAARKAIVVDAADYPGAEELCRNLAIQQTDLQPRLLLVESEQIGVIRPYLEDNPLLDFAVKPVSGQELELRLEKFSETLRVRDEQPTDPRPAHAPSVRGDDTGRVSELPNVEFFHDHLAFQIRHAQRYSRQLAVLVVDLQSFEGVKKLLGDEGTRNLLSSSSQRIMQELRDHDLVAQALGGLGIPDDQIVSRIDEDRFIVLISEFQHIKDVSAIVERIISVVAKPIYVGEQQMVPDPKVGISLFPSDGEDAAALIRNASSALEFSLDHQLGRYGFFAESANKLMADRFSLEARLRKAIDECAFELHYQPKVALESGATIGLEALIRWRDPELGDVSPARFIPLAEELGFINELSRWVVQEACRQCRSWLNEGVPTVPVAVNLSGQDFLRSDFPDFVTTVLLENEIAPQNLELEITEGVVIENLAVAAAMLEELRKIGVKIALDDFGTGYSSLSYLHRIPIDTLKIDRSFIRNITSDWNCAAITSGVITLSHILNLNVVAEGVETAEQLELLKDQNCNAIQGAVYSMPLSAEKTTDWLRSQGTA